MQDTDDPLPSGRQPVIRVMTMPADANPAGQIFGGWIMSQMDVAGAIAAVDATGGRVATVAVASMEFHKPVHVGDLVSCYSEVSNIGTSSITVRVEVYSQRFRDGGPQCVKVTGAVIVYVAVNKDGSKRQLQHPPA